MGIQKISTRVFETRTATGREHFACQDGGISQIFILVISNGESILSNVNVVVGRQVKRDTWCWISKLGVHLIICVSRHKVNTLRVVRISKIKSERRHIFCPFDERTV